jgi:hypothetical protein
MDEIIYLDMNIDNSEEKRIKGDKNKRRTRSESGTER